MKLAIVGSGYVGLVTAVCFAELGNDVTCIDIDEAKIAKLKQGHIPIYEPGLEEMLHNNRQRLKFTTDLKNSIQEAEIIFICVGTPPRENGEADLSAVENVAKTIAEVMRSYKLIVEKSTVPVKTGEMVAGSIKEHNIHKSDFDVVSNPEFLREGSAVSDFMNPDRIVIGCGSQRAREIMERLYSPLKARIIFTDINSAEIIKHASNSFLATKISFINAVSRICELAGADIGKVAEGMGHDKRIGRSFLDAGIGYGGFCFPKDSEAFIKIAEKLGYDFKLLKATQEINQLQKEHFIEKAEKILGTFNGKKIGILGLAFKPNTDDMRFAPSIDIINALQHKGAIIKAYDPQSMEKSQLVLHNVEYCASPYEASKDTDALLILTEWNEFKELDLQRIKNGMKGRAIVDGRNIYNPYEMKKHGFRYASMGRQET